MPRILIVDDSLFQRSNIRELLNDPGYEFLEAADGESALRMISEQAPDCMLLDLVMPGMDGFAVLERLQSENNPLPVIVISADIQTTSQQRCLDLGVKAVVNKPLAPISELPKILRQVLAV